MEFGLTNESEAFLAFQTFCRIWGSGGCGSLNLDTKEGEVTLKLEQKLGPLHGLRPGPRGRQGPSNPVSKETEVNEQVRTKSQSKIRRQEQRKKASEEIKEHANEPTTSILSEKVAALVKEKSFKNEKDGNTKTTCPNCGSTLTHKNSVCPYICFECEQTYRTIQQLEAHWESTDCRSNYKAE